MPIEKLRSSLAPLYALALALALFSSQDALAQQAPPPSEPPARSETKPDFLGSIGRWFDESFAKIGSSFKDARSGVDNFNREAGIAAKSTADAAKDAADAVVKLPNAKVVRGHQNCVAAPNGAPDCIAAATALCKASGFGTGKSIDITSAEECPTQVMLGRRAAEPGECRTVNFVSRALCQ